MDIDFVEFRQLQEVGIFSYLVYSLVKNHFNGWGFVEAWMAVFSVSKSLNRVKKIPIVWSCIVSCLGFNCSRDMLCDFCVVG